MNLTFCIVGIALLVLAAILCAITENKILWISILIIEEIVAFLGYAPVFARQIDLFTLFPILHLTSGRLLIRRTVQCLVGRLYLVLEKLSNT